MKQLKIALTVAALTAGSAAAAWAQTINYVTNAYDAKVQQVAAGAFGTSQYSVFAGEAKAANNKVAADLKGFAFTLFYTADASGAVNIAGGTFLIQTTNKDRSPLVIGGQVLPAGRIDVRPNGWIVSGETVTLSLVGSTGTGVSGTLTATIDKSNPPRATGSLYVTYPVVQ